MRIKTISLEGFKAQKDREIVLGERTLLVGDNGAGKSAVMEGLVYALSGRVPTGKSAERVGRYFGPNGGLIRVYDEGSNYLGRGVDRGKGAAVHETLVMEPEDPALWESNEHLLDIRGFLGLSPEKRRSVVLELVGAGSLDDVGELECVIGAATAKELAGAGATIETLTVEERILDLPEELQPVVRLWGEIWDQLKTVATHHRGTASQLFQRLTKDASEMKLAARRAGANASSAAEELEAGVRGAKAAAEEIDFAQEAVTAQELVLAEQRTLAGAYREVVREEQEARAAIGKLLGRAKDWQERVDSFERLEDKAEPPEPNAETKATEKLYYESSEALKRLESENNLRREINIQRGLEKELDDGPIGELVSAWEEFGKALENFSSKVVPPPGRLGQAIRAVAANWAARKDSIHAKIQELSGQLPPDPPDRGLSKGPDLQERIDAVAEEVELYRVALKNFRDGDEAALKLYRTDLKAWESEVERRHEVTKRRDEANAALAEAEKRHKGALKRLRQSKAPSVEEAEKSLQEAQEALSKAQEASGMVTAYERTLARAAQSRYEEAIWKAVEKACQSAREVYVADVAEPLVSDIQEALSQMEVDRSVRLTLETASGRPIFELGWTADGQPVSVETMSNGEAALFLTALVVAIARRAKGRKVLLVEAETLTAANVERLLWGIARLPDSWDACIVATPHLDAEDIETDDWTVVEVE